MTFGYQLASQFCRGAFLSSYFRGHPSGFQFLKVISTRSHNSKEVVCVPLAYELGMSMFLLLKLVSAQPRDWHVKGLPINTFRVKE